MDGEGLDAYSYDYDYEYVEDEEIDTPAPQQSVEVAYFNVMWQVGEYLKNLYRHPPQNMAQIAAGISTAEARYDAEEVLLCYKTMEQKGRRLKHNLILGQDKDGHMTLQYEPEHAVYSREEVKDFIYSRLREVKATSLQSSYVKCKEDMVDLIRTGEVIGLWAPASGETIISRPEHYMCKLPGQGIVRRGSRIIETTMDLRPDIRRGETIRIGDDNQCYRVSTASQEKVVKKVFSLRLSATSGKQPNTQYFKPMYIFPYNSCVLSLDRPYNGPPSDEPLDLYKYGVSNEFRGVWYEMAEASSWPKDSKAMMKLLQEQGFDVEGEAEGHKLGGVKKDLELKIIRTGPKKKRVRKKF
jgi:hypothetical protein